jgi:hypothetical protein
MFRLALFLLVLSCRAFAQAPAAPTPQPSTAQPLFRADLPGGVYEVAVRQIVSVSSHEYLVDGAVRVTEVNIDTQGSVLARFYHFELNAPAVPSGFGAAGVQKTQQLLTEAAGKTGQDVWKQVIKNYPTTTHSRTVEYRLATLEDLKKVFNAAEQAFRLQKNHSVKLD